ncbi:lytic polysaccharide monooxygenase [Glonium stellatum]|uniref:lytic cellulose monooxygenase (C4-dehydrogenating) n=1 Tax=Glonium stellatum TaxID=574774 RepID=A0A8E2ENT2_9PEZI|nr:lytic polysaccharide monooxygenase [Glonium stellatum]
MKPITICIALAACFQAVHAHYRWTSLIVNGTTTGAFYYVRQNTNYNSPLTDVTSNDIRCNTGTLASGPTTNVATVIAGSTVGMALDQTIFHIGPLLAYLSKAPSDIHTYDGSGAWFKIAQTGPSFSSGAISWPTQVSQYTFKIPASTPPGLYLLRVEHIAVHSAKTVDGAQFYIACAQIDVRGSGGGAPAPTVSLPGAYSSSDPGILFNDYYPIPTSYTMPGPAVWAG